MLIASAKDNVLVLSRRYEMHMKYITPKVTLLNVSENIQGLLIYVYKSAVERLRKIFMKLENWFQVCEIERFVAKIKQSTIYRITINNVVVICYKDNDRMANKPSFSWFYHF